MLLLIVLALLALFAIIGVTFVLLSSHEQRAAEAMARAAQSNADPRGDFEETILQILRGTRQSNSVLQTHSLLEDIHGDDVVSGRITAAAVNTSNSTLVDLTVPDVSSVDLARCGFTSTVRPRLTLVDPPLTALMEPARDSLIVQAVGGVITIRPWPNLAASQATTMSAQLVNELQNFLGSEPISFVVAPLQPRQLGSVAQVAGGQLLQLTLAEANHHVGKIITMLDGPAAGLSTRIVGLDPSDTTNTRVHALPFANGMLPAAGNPFVLNNTPFAGTGVGYNPDVTGTGPQLNEVDPEFAAYGSRVRTALVPFAPINRAIFGGANEEYDAADYQNMLLAMQDPESGAAPLPSLHRSELVNYWLNQLDQWHADPNSWFKWPDNAPTAVERRQAFLAPYGPTYLRADAPATWNWNDIVIADRLVALKRRMIARPQREDHPYFTGSNPGFNPLWDGISPSGGNWDVDNDADGIPDSIWVDVGLPVRTDKDGRLYKPLVAILCVDMDGRLNLNAHGSLAQLHTGYGSDANVGGNMVPDGSGGTIIPSPSLDVPRGGGLGPAEADLSTVLGDVSGVNAAQQYYRLLADRYNSGDSDTTNDCPGIMLGDPLWANKRFDCPSQYNPTTLAGTLSYGTPLDWTGGLMVGLDLRGQPLYVPLGSGMLPVNGVGITATDNPYEFNLSGVSRGVVAPMAANVPPDAPFTPADLEAILRPYDVDASERPIRLPTLAPSLLPYYDSDTDQWVHHNREVTTDSWHVPVAAAALPPELRATGTLPGNRATHVVDLLRAKLRDTNPTLDEAMMARAIARLLPPEVIAGLRMDLNRPLGNGQDDNGNNVIDEPARVIRDTGNPDQFIVDTNYPGEVTESMPQVNQAGATVAGISFSHANNQNVNNDRNGATDLVNSADNAMARQLYARQLYVMMLLLMNYDPTAANADQYARQAAQWAVNIVDFRDRDAIMTSFEYDLDPFTDNSSPSDPADNWNPWDVDGVVDPVSKPANTDDNASYRGLVWGCERPELLLTETLAVHDRRTSDTTLDPTGKDTVTSPSPKDDDFDQFYRPQGSLFVELYNPWTSNEPLPGEFYDATAGGVALDRRVPDASGNGSPVWRMLIVQRDGASEANLNKDPDAINPADRPDIERAAYFVDSTAGLPSDGDVHYYRAGANNPITPIGPGRYAVIGPTDEDNAGPSKTYLGGCPMTAADADRTRRIVLDPNAAKQVQVFADGMNDAIPDASSSIQPPTAILLGGPRRFSISEPKQGYPGDDPTGVAGTGAINPTTGMYTYVQAYDMPQDKERDDSDNWEQWIKNTGTQTRVAIIHLQRLANPLVPHDPETNPYRTIDSTAVDLTTYNGVEDDRGNLGATDGGEDKQTPFCSQERAEDKKGIWDEAVEPDVKKSSVNTNNVWAQLSQGQQTSLPRPSPATVALDASVAALHRYTKDFTCTLGYLNEGYQSFVVTDPLAPKPPATWWTTSSPGPPAAEYRGSPLTPFPWFTWLNRPLASAADLMLVPRWRSYDLLRPTSFDLAADTSNPYANPTHPFPQLVNYFLDAAPPMAEPNWKLHRLLGFVGVPSQFAGTELQGNPTSFTENGTNTHSFHPPFNRISQYREPGRININTITSQSVWNGLMGDFASSTGGPTWAQLVDSRRGYGTSGDQWEIDSSVNPLPTRFAHPFRSFAGRYLTPTTALQNAAGSSEINATLLREGAAGQPLFGFESTQYFNHTNRNPAFRYQLFNRLENMTTTRSNVYAVWVTIGYFEVTPVTWVAHHQIAGGVWVDDQDRTQQQFVQIYPDGYQLGAELGSDSGETQRHRGFAIIDRSIPVGFQRGENLNVENTILLRRFIE